MAQNPDVLIVGGGVIGLTTAFYLAREGVAATVLDQGDLGRQASWAGAGIIPPGNVARAREPYDRLRAFSSSLYPILSRELREQTGIDNGHRVCGGIEIAELGEEIPVLIWEREGIAFEALNARELRQKAPGLSAEGRQGYFLPGMAQVRNPRHLKALITACESLGTRLRPHCPVRAIVYRGRTAVGVETDRGHIDASQILVTAGAWSDELLKPLGCRLPIEPIRGQIALLNTGEPGERPILLQGKRYLVWRGDGRVLVGSTEEDAGFDARPTAGGIEGLLAFAQELVPALGDATVEQCWAGLRPGSPDGLPFLGPVPGYDNLFVAAGHFRAGLQLSPGTGLVMKELLLGQTTSVPLHAFRLDRPPCPAGQTAFRS